MALAGIHVTFGFARVGGGTYNNGSSVLPYKAQSSQNQTSPGTLSITAPQSLDAATPVLCSISAAAPIFYVVGPNPNISTGVRRYYDPSSGREDIFVDPGDTIAWTTA